MRYMAMWCGRVFPCFERYVWHIDSDRRLFAVEDSPYAADLQAHLGVETMHEVLTLFKTAFANFPLRELATQGPTQGTTCEPLSPQERELYEICVPAAVPQPLLDYFERLKRPPNNTIFELRMIRAASLAAARVALRTAASAKVSMSPELFLAARGEALESILPGAYQWVVSNISYTMVDFQMLNLSIDVRRTDSWTGETLERKYHPWTAEVHFTICANGLKEKRIHYSGFTHHQNQQTRSGPTPDDYDFLDGSLSMEWRRSFLRVERDRLLRLMTTFDVDKRWQPTDFALLLRAVAVCPSAVSLPATHEELQRGPAWPRFAEIGTVELMDSIESPGEFARWSQWKKWRADESYQSPPWMWGPVTEAEPHLGDDGSLFPAQTEDEFECGSDTSSE
ncbi:hypothetical protein HDU90_006701 [Geranomyces variabilis]|nr:hypothetical protein HDU90_006701 [Geranomyces variabilis]